MEKVEYDFHPIVYLVFDYVNLVADIETYHKMTDEQRRKLIGKLTITACKKFSPRKNYDISKEDVRGIVAMALDIYSKDTE